MARSVRGLVFDQTYHRLLQAHQPLLLVGVLNLDHPTTCWSMNIYPVGDVGPPYLLQIESS